MYVNHLISNIVKVLLFYFGPESVQLQLSGMRVK